MDRNIMKKSGDKILIGTLALSFFLMVFKQWSFSLGILILVVPYFIYWIINHDRTIDKIEAFIHYILIVVMAISNFALIYIDLGIIFNGELLHDDKACFYFSIVTWTTLGYGDFQPSEAARFWAAAEAIMGYLMMAVLAALVLNLFQQKHTLGSNNA